MRSFRYLFAWFVLGASIVYIILFLIQLRSSDTVPVISPLVSFPLGILNSSNETQIKSEQELHTIIEQSLQNANGTYGVVVSNLGTTEEAIFNEHHIFDSASLYKLWVMATVFDEIKRGKLKQTQVLQQDIVTLNRKFQIASESAERTEGTINLTVEQALSRMISISDNYAALLLSEKVGLSKVDAFLRNHQFIESKIGIDGSTPSTSASDIALFFKKLYKGELIDRETDMEMLNLLKTQEINHKIPKKLPTTLQIAHKTGELGYVSHDAGIIFSPAGDILVVVLTESDIPAIAVENISTLSKELYSYFNK